MMSFFWDSLQIIVKLLSNLTGLRDARSYNFY